MLNQYFKYIDKSGTKRQYLMPVFLVVFWTHGAGKNYRRIKNEVDKKFGDVYSGFHQRLKALNIKAQKHPNNHRQAVGLRQLRWQNLPIG